MIAVANNPKFAKKVGIPQSVGRDFSNADKGHKFLKGGDIMATKSMPKGLFKGKESFGEELKEANAIKSGKLSPTDYAKNEQTEDKTKTKKFAKGGSIDGIAQRGKTQAPEARMAKGGKCK